MRKSIVFVIVYFGKVPWYFKFFNNSCAYNPDVDFILITDMDVSGNLANNITLVNSSPDEISKRFTEKLGFEINIVHPYKLCDLKPAYGLVFSDMIEEYDFWGFCDIDLLFGNIRSLITSDILNRYDVVTTKAQFIAGFFSLFRNNEKVNNIFKSSKDYKKVFQAQSYYNFDECNWEFDDLLHGKDVSELNSEIFSFTHVIRNAVRAGDISVFWHNMEYHPGHLAWDYGNLFYKDERALFCHLVYFKNLDFKYVPHWKTMPEKFFMNSFYFSKYAPGSPADLCLRFLLMLTRRVTGVLNILNQYAKWGISYLFSSRRIDVKNMRHPERLTGIYKSNELEVSILVIDQCLHGSVNGSKFPLLHKGAGRFVLAKCRFQQLVNVELDFRVNEYDSVNAVQVTGSGFWRQTFFRIF